MDVAPAAEALEYQPKRFAFGVGDDKTIYQGEPSPELDQAWHDLYDGAFALLLVSFRRWLMAMGVDFGLSKIPKEQARLLPNKTLPIPGDEENYAVSLSVFHQLHCLVRLPLPFLHLTFLLLQRLLTLIFHFLPEHRPQRPLPRILHRHRSRHHRGRPIRRLARTSQSLSRRHPSKSHVFRRHQVRLSSPLLHVQFAH